MSNPRKGLPSASSFERLVKCLASRRAADAASYIPDEDSEEAREGTMLHEIVNRDDSRRQTLEGEQLWAVKTCEKLLASAVEQAEFQGAVVMEERRLWAHDDDFEPIFSGQMDWLHIDGQRGLFIDLKFGRLLVDPADVNLQMLGYALLGWLTFGLSDVYVAVIQPRVEQAHRLSMARYDNETLVKSYEWITSLLKAGQLPGQPYSPGKWCRYCPALTACLPAFYFHTNVTDKTELLQPKDFDYGHTNDYAGNEY